jgi:hypothetical protein
VLGAAAVAIPVVVCVAAVEAGADGVTVVCVSEGDDRALALGGDVADADVDGAGGPATLPWELHATNDRVPASASPAVVNRFLAFT